MQREHPAKQRAHLGQVGQGEDSPADDDEKDQVNVREHLALFQVFEQKALFNHQQHKEVQSPEDKVPGGAVPEAGQEPDDKDVEKLAALFDPVSAQRDVDIIAEPGAEGDVPPAPEFGDAFGDVGVIEVLREEKAQHPSQADCHQRVAAEVKVNLEAVGDDAHPGKRGGYLRKAERLHLGPQRTDGVCQKNLAGKAHDEQAHTLVDLRQGDLAALELPADVRVQDNRTGNQLREEHDEGAEVDQVVLHLDFAPVDIHRVGQNLEGVKADAQRQVELGGIQQRQAQPQQGIDVGQEEVCVLKEEQEAQRDEKGDPETSLARLFIVVIPLHQQSGNVVDAD